MLGHPSITILVAVHVLIGCQDNQTSEFIKNVDIALRSWILDYFIIVNGTLDNFENSPFHFN